MRALISIAILSIFTGIFTIANAQANPALLVIVPESDTSAAAASQRVSGCTVPEAKVTLNGRDVRVYPTGAFGGVVVTIKPTTNDS